MSDDSGLLQAVWADPDDDGPRLVYADWLEENGQQERAEFIRVQCALASPGLSTARRKRLRAREAELLASPRKQWLGRLRRSSLPWVFHRGFVGGLDATGVFRRGPIYWKDECYYNYVRFFPDGRILRGCAYGHPRSLRSVNRIMQPGGRNVSPGSYTLALADGHVAVRFTLPRGDYKGRYDGTIHGTVLRLPVPLRGAALFRECYRWLSLARAR